MYLLPRGKVIKEQLDTARLKMPAALLKMCTNHFSGYLAFENDTSHGVLCYAKGKIIAALWQDAAERLCGKNALQKLFQELQRDGRLMSVYRLNDDLLPYVQQYCHANVECAAQVVELLDFNRLTDKLHREQFNGSLRLYSDKRTVIIFYSVGKAQGFFCDGDDSLRSDIDISKSIVMDGNCLLDINRNNFNTDKHNSLTGVNLERVWLDIWRELNP